MAKLPHTLARLRVCRDARQSVAEDLLTDAIECLEAIASADELRHRRDEYIRRAALLTSAPSVTKKAESLVTEANALARRRNAGAAVVADREPNTVVECLAMASAFYTLPTSWRQMVRVLQESANDPQA